MVDYVTREALRSLGQQNLNENLQRVRKAEQRSAEGTTFLSHSSKDDEVMPGVVMILENHGATVYLDKKDGSLAGKAPKEIAHTLRGRITACKKFILFASENNKASKWTPWELGLADGFKSPRKVCIFPAPDKATDHEWAEQEYLGVYDRIVWGTFKQKHQPEWMVWNHKENSAIALGEWISRY